MKCQQCEFDYPEKLLSQFYDSHHPEVLMICGVCALDLMNATHGDNRTEFDGPGAEMLRKAALKYQKDHPQTKENPNAPQQQTNSDQNR